MRSRCTEGFWKLYRHLPREVQQRANRAYRTWFDNPFHPGLQFKGVNANRPIYSVRIGRDWRACGVVEDDMVIWFWIGSHSDYDRLLKGL